MTTTGTSSSSIAAARRRCGRLVSWLQQGSDGAGLAVFRILFGLILAASAIRFVAKGWVQELYLTPKFHFSYPGLGWIKPLPGVGLYVVFAIMCICALLMAAGLFYRCAAAAVFVTFTYIELLDQTYYLNHYYFVSLLSGLLCMLPANSMWCLGTKTKQPVRRWHLLLLRAQVALVYTFAGLAKVNADWLIEGQPLKQWLPVHADLPIIGPLLLLPWVAVVASWIGAAYDLSIAWLISWRSTRWLAMSAIVGFHVMTGLLFNIGVFPFIMVAASTLMLPPGWPRSCLPDAETNATAGGTKTTNLALAFAAGFLFIQAMLPLRHLLLTDDVNWTGQGYRFSWRVMLTERTGHVEFRVEERNGNRKWLVQPYRELSHMQANMMAIEPDFMADYAAELARRFNKQGIDVMVFADSWVAINGRRSQRYIDPTVDLSLHPVVLLQR